MRIVSQVGRIALGLLLISNSTASAYSSSVCRGMATTSTAMEHLSSISLTPVKDGKILSDQPIITANQLWHDRPAMVYVVRRPG